MTYKVTTSKQFEKEVKLCSKRGYDMESLRAVIKILTEKGVLPKEYKPHKLKCDFKGTIECHIAADWLLIYEKAEEIKLIRLVRTGTHSDLFNK